MLSHGKAGIDPGRWAYATLPKPLDLEASVFTTQGSWPLLWSLEVRATPMLADAGPSALRWRLVGGSSRIHRGLDKPLLDGSRCLHEQRRIIGDHSPGR